jgi:hypothetical protein
VALASGCRCSAQADNGMAGTVLPDSRPPPAGPEYVSCDRRFSSSPKRPCRAAREPELWLRKIMDPGTPECRKDRQCTDSPGNRISGTDHTW